MPKFTQLFIVQHVADPECPLHTSIDRVTKIDVGSQDTVQNLRNALPESAVPLAWEPIQQLVECSHCGFQEIRWGLPAVELCPQCQQPLRPRTTLELVEVPGNIKLEELGIPPREILTVRIGDNLKWFELKE